MNLLLPALLWTATALAQYGGLASTSDGSKLYFSTTHQLKGSNLPNASRVYSYDGREFRLHFAPQDANISSVEVSDDGNVQIFATAAGPRFQQSFLKIGEDVFPYPGSLQMSRNGRYLLHQQYDDQNSLLRIRWIDLQEGIIRDLPDGSSAQGRYALTDDGRALLQIPGSGLVLWKDGETQSIPNTCSPAWINPTGFYIVSLCSRLVPVPNRTPILPLFTLVCDAYMQRTALADNRKLQDNVDTSGPIALTSRYWLMPNGALVNLASSSAGPPRSFTAASISSGAFFLFAVTGGKLIRRNLASQEETVLIPSLPVLTPPTYPIAAVPGSIMVVPVEQLTNATPISLAGRNLATLVRPIGPPAVQIPWDMPTGIHRLELFSDPGSAFETTPIQVPIYDWYPSNPPQLDWTNFSAFTPQVDRFPFRLPRPGELADLYVTGLGAVNIPPPYGDPTPADFPRTVRHAVQATLRDTLTQRQFPLPVISAALAPGLVGTYVVQVRLPDVTTLAAPSYLTRLPVLIEVGPAGPAGVAVISSVIFLR